MAITVVKRDGSKEPFDESKIRQAVEAAASAAKVPSGKVGDLVKRVLEGVVLISKNREEIASVAIREKILSDLDKMEPSVSAAWRKHDLEKGKK